MDFQNEAAKTDAHYYESRATQTADDAFDYSAMNLDLYTRTHEVVRDIMASVTKTIVSSSY